MKDLIIVGGGPAGITAAVYAARKKIGFSMITKDIGGQAAWSADIENYTGHQFITGPELVEKFRSHLENYDFELFEGLDALKVEKIPGGFKVAASGGQILSSRTLIIATGKKPKDLNVAGEQGFKGKGVHYCSTCDGPMFADKDVAIVGGGNSALDAAISMMNISTKVYVICNSRELSGDPVMRDKVTKSKNVEILLNARALEIKGDKFVKTIRIEQGGEQRDIEVQGIFVEVGLTPNSDFIDCVEKNGLKEIMINCAAETSCPGIFAAGDVTNVPDKQIIIAAGDGAKAALSAFKFLSTHQGKT